MWHDQSAAVAPMIAALGAILIGAAGFALDAGLYYVGERGLRAATDAAALAAAMNPAQAAARARDSLSRNGYDPAILQSVELGRYCADAAIAPAQRFDPSMTLCPGNGRVNAVRIRTGKPARQFLMRVLGPANPLPDLAASATATRIDEAGVGITSGILTVTNALVNSINDLLGALIGIKLRLSTADIETLMASNVDAGLFFDALAQRVGESGTYAALTARTAGLQDLLLAAASAADTSATAATLTLLAGQVGTGLVNAYIGTLPAGAMTRPMPALSAADVRPTRIVNLLGVVTVDSRAVAQPVMGNSGGLVFGPGGQGSIGRPGSPGTPASIGNGSQVGPLLTSLVGSLAASDGLQVQLLGLCLPVVCETTAALARSQLVNGVVTPVAGLVGTTIDPLVTNLLAALGVQLGHATLWVTGARCAVPVLV